MMDGIWQWGLVVMTTLQSARGPVLDAMFRAFTFLGEEAFYLLLFPTLLWCVDARLGFRLGVLVLISFYFNSFIKDVLGHPRPFDLDPPVKLVDAEGYGLPSGHAQSAALVWGGVAAHTRSRWVWGATVGLAGLIGFYRVYLRAHFPTDVLAGWAVGGVLVLVGSAVYAATADIFRTRPLAVQIPFAIAGPTILALLFPDTSAVSAMGALAGLATGFAISIRYLRVTAEGPWWQHGLRLLVGLAILFVLHVGLRSVLPGEEAVLHLVFRFTRYAVLGLWISLGAPWVFSKLRLSRHFAPRPAVVGAG